jgi:hypothetical protein
MVSTKSIMDLFNTAGSANAATWLAVISFAAGVAVTSIIAFLLRLKGCSNGCKSANNKAHGNAKFEKRHQPPVKGAIEIYVGNLSYELTEDRLRKEFEAFGKVVSARIITNRYNGKSKGFGFVHMTDRAEVEAAVKGLNDKDILGRKLKCNEARNAE